MKALTSQPSFSAESLYASLSPKTRATIESVGGDHDVEALACRVLAEYIRKGMNDCRDFLPVDKQNMAACFLDTRHPLSGAFRLSLMVQPRDVCSPRVTAALDRAEGISLPHSARRELADRYVIRRTAVDMAVCDAVRERITQPLPRSEPFQRLSTISRYVDSLRRKCKCIQCSEEGWRPAPGDRFWMNRPVFQAVDNIPYFMVGFGDDAEECVDHVLAIEKRTRGDARRLRSTLLETAAVWEEVKPVLDEAAGHIYQGRHALACEVERSLASTLRRLEKLDERLEAVNVKPWFYKQYLANALIWYRTNRYYYMAAACCAFTVKLWPGWSVTYKQLAPKPQRASRGDRRSQLTGDSCLHVVSADA